jgi:diguanylate cyclase (GGDEF)-like protein
MGGDEFVIVAPGLTPEATMQKAKTLDEMTTAVGRQICGEDLLGLSVGTAFYPQDGCDPELLLTEADRRMYSVKQVHHSRAEDEIENGLSGVEKE